MKARNVIDRFLEQCLAQPDALALWVDGRGMTYTDVKNGMLSIAATLCSLSATEAQEPVAFVADRSFGSYLAMLAAVLIGKPFVPVHPRHPASRNHAILKVTDCGVFVVGAGGASAALAMLAHHTKPTTLIWVDADHEPPSEFETMGHCVLRLVCPDADILVSRNLPASQRIAYILFTSGSTGTPKGVAVSHANLLSYVDFMIAAYAPVPSDRFSQTFDQTFDLAMHDLYVSLSAGASLHVIPDREQLSPGRFIKRRELTHWFSTPSTAAVMLRSGGLAPGSFPSLRRSLFCGEALPYELARSWSRAAANSAVENLYGPTEATIAITRFPVHIPVAEKAAGIVPIGHAFHQGNAALCGHDGAYIAPIDGAEGELILSGDQISIGYWSDMERTALAFRNDIRSDPSGSRWYKTGDLVRYEDKNGFLFLGRLDDQVKIRGHRVELAEVEIALRTASGCALAAAIAWPRTEIGSEGIVGFVCGSTELEQTIRERCASLVPTYMIPRRVVVLDEMPVNTNGKIDKQALVDILASRKD